MTSVIKTDILIIGTGIAGLSCALKLADLFKVTLISKTEAIESNTRYAQGGIASVMQSTDDFQAHVDDTLRAGAGLCHEDVVQKIVRDGPRLVDELINLGVQFSKDADHHYDLGREGGHTQRRVLHAGDSTGKELATRLLHSAQNHPNIRFCEYHIAIDLIPSQKITSTGPNRCLGAYILDQKNNQVLNFEAQHTILATGGSSKVYLYTSNPDVATADGVAMAYRAGVPIVNLEFVQFHPTCLYNPGAFSPLAQEKPNPQKSFLISETLRGEGGRLYRIDGTSFMENYDDRKELAPRDIVARAIDAEMKKHGDDYVFLDISHRDADFIKQRFPHIFAICQEYGLDITQKPIPVVPAAHYFCGGVQTNLHGQTPLDGLYAIGEVACTGLHGANRLASNSLLEACALADYTAKHITNQKVESTLKSPTPPTWNPGKASDSNEAVIINQTWEEIRRLMWNYVGIVRSNDRLHRALNRLAIIQQEIKDYYWKFTITRDLIELRNVALTAELIVRSALSRKESRGLHYNVDFPETLDKEKKDTVLTFRLTIDN